MTVGNLDIIRKQLIAQGYHQLIATFIVSLMKDYKRGNVNIDELKVIFRGLDNYADAVKKQIKVRVRITDEENTPQE